ncbi:MAG: division/cell wall cluster transcriptional repressor MraZ [Deltaproteobacteria bacterium]
MFRGRSVHNLDAKGRLSIPARFREVLRAKYGEERLIVTNLPECLVAYPLDEWRILEEEFTRIRFAPPEVLAFQRYFIAGGLECPLDSHGRILLPPTLREPAGIDKEIVLSGMLTHFEIWDKERLDAELKKARENFDSYSRAISGTGLRA